MQALGMGGPNAVIAAASGLEPDLLGEAMVLRTLNNEVGEVRGYLDRVFEGAGEGAVRTGFEVLGRLSDENKEATVWIAHLLGRDVAGRTLAAFKAARTIGARTAHSLLGLELARALEREGTPSEIAERLTIIGQVLRSQSNH